MTWNMKVVSIVIEAVVAVLLFALEYTYLELVEILFHMKRKTKAGSTFTLLALANITPFCAIIYYIFRRMVNSSILDGFFDERNLLFFVWIVMFYLARPISYALIFKSIDKKIMGFALAICFFPEPFGALIRFGMECLHIDSSHVHEIHFYIIPEFLFFYSILYVMKIRRGGSGIRSFITYINPLHIVSFGVVVLLSRNILFADQDTFFYERERASYALFVIIAVLIGSIFITAVRARKYQIQSMELEKQFSNQVEYYKKLDDIYTDMRSFRHDFKNHIFCIESMVKEKRYEEIMEYLEDIRGLSQQKLAVFDTGNLVINAMLTEKASEAQKVGANIIFTGMIPKQGIKVVDLCTIFANAVDNAVEACGRGEGQKEIKIESNVYQGYYFLNISNPYFEELKKARNGLLETSKEDKQYHGFGLKNIKDTVKKYSGKMDINMKDGIFSLQMEMLIGREED